MASEISAGPESGVATHLAMLERAHAAFASGRPLICGHSPEDLSDGQLSWLRAHRPAAIPPPG